MSWHGEVLIVIAMRLSSSSSKKKLLMIHMNRSSQTKIGISMDALQEAINKRDEFLKERPHLKQQQVELDEILDKCRDESDRLAVVNMLMMKSMIELQKHTIKLKELI
jgi:hypothetical protein